MCDTIKNLSTSGPLWIFQKGSSLIVSYFSFVTEIQIQTIENSVRLLFFFFALQYCIGFATHRHESATGVHVPNPEPPLPTPPNTIPLGHSSAPA